MFVANATCGPGVDSEDKPYRSRSDIPPTVGVTSTATTETGSDSVHHPDDVRPSNSGCDFAMARSLDVALGRNVTPT